MLSKCNESRHARDVIMYSIASISCLTASMDGDANARMAYAVHAMLYGLHLQHSVSGYPPSAMGDRPTEACCLRFTCAGSKSCNQSQLRLLFLPSVESDRLYFTPLFGCRSSFYQCLGIYLRVL